MKAWLILIALVIGPDGKPVGSMEAIMVDRADCEPMAIEAMRAGLIAACMEAPKNVGL